MLNSEFLRDRHGHPFAIKGDVSLEVEVESVTPLMIPALDNWEIKGDGSLRNYGYEFVTKQPLKANYMKANNIKVLFDAFPKTVIHDCPRTSVHVHTNVLELTPLQTWTYICAYYLFENLLTAHCGENRVGNAFCLRLKDAEKATYYITEDLKRDVPFISLETDRLKYLGGNVNALPRFGSFEVRTMRGCYETAVIDGWTSELILLRDNSKKFMTPALLMDAFWNYGAELIAELFSIDFSNKLTKIPNWNVLVEENAALVCTIAYSQDWGKWETRIEKALKKYQAPPKVKADRVDQLARDIEARVAQARPDARARANAIRAQAAVDWGGINIAPMPDMPAPVVEDDDF